MIIQNNEDWFRLTSDDITKEFIYKNFAPSDKGEAPHKFNDRLETPSSLENDVLFMSFDGALEKRETTKGRVLFNIFVYEPLLLRAKEDKNFPVIPFNNDPITAGAFKKIEGQFTKLFIDGKIEATIMEDFINRTQWLGYIISTFSLPSLDYKTLVMDDDIVSYKNKVFKDNERVFENNDAVTFSEMEKDILKVTVNKLNTNGATGIITYNSGWNGSIENNLKNTSLFRGIAPTSYDPSKYVISKSNLVDGVAKEDIVSHADIAIAGSSGRAIDTQVGGYETKKFNAAFSHLIAGEKGTDCKTKYTRKVSITKDNIGLYKDRYIVVNGNTVLIDDSFIGKTVNMRTPIYCGMPGVICNKCLGESFYKYKIKNIGLNASRVSATIMYVSMKSFHNLATTPKVLGIMKYITIDNDIDIIEDDLDD